MDENATDTKPTPPYIAFKTITTLIERMAREEPPDRIDKSYLDNFSGGYQTQVLAALHSLRFLDSEGHLSDRLKALVKGGEPERKALVAQITREFYADVLRLGTNATQQQLLEAFSAMSPKVTGDTRRKAIAFFLNACQYGGVPVSRHWKTPRVPPTGKRSAATGKGGQLPKGSTDDQAETEDQAPIPTPNTRSLVLRSGGRITLSLSVDLFSLRGEDRDFVFDLIDKMSAYEDASPESEEEDDEN